MQTEMRQVRIAQECSEMGSTHFNTFLGTVLNDESCLLKLRQNFYEV